MQRNPPALMPGQMAKPGAIYAYGLPREWAWECWLCEARGFGFANRAKASEAFTAHRATHHALTGGQP